MKDGWKINTLKELSIISGDYGLSVPSKPFDGVRYLRITDITDSGDLNDDKVSANIENDKKQEELQEGDVLFARTGATVGKTLVFRKEFGECLYAGYLIRYRLNKDIILPRYMHYITHSSEYYDWVAINQEAAAQPNISAKKYNLLPVRYPSLEEQQTIVTRLDAAFADIDALKSNAEKALDEAKALFQASLKEMLEPKEGWEEKYFGDVCSYHKELGNYKDAIYIGMEHMESGTGRILGTMSSNDVLSTSFKFNKGEVLYGRLRPYLKKVYIAEFDGCCSTEVFPIVSEIVEAGFIKYWLLSEEITNKINATSAGCRMPRGNMNEVKKFSFVYPRNREYQQQIVSHLDSMSEKVRKLEEVQRKTIAECDAMKQAMLREVFE